jgi:hypothetical protein
MGVGHLESMLPRPDADQKLALESIKEATAHLMNVAEDATQLARPASEVSLSREASNLAVLLRRAVGVVQEQASKRQVILDVVTPPFIPEVSVDPKRLSRVMVNLLANAVSYSPAGTRVKAELQWDEAKETLGVAVEDAGPGLPHGMEDVVFEPFVQVGEARKQGGGIGLGLAIVKRFVEAHKGRVGVASVPGRGARFSFTIPVPIGARMIPTATGGGLPSRRRRFAGTRWWWRTTRMPCGRSSRPRSNVRGPSYSKRPTASWRFNFSRRIASISCSSTDRCGTSTARPRCVGFVRTRGSANPASRC